MTDVEVIKAAVRYKTKQRAGFRAQLTRNLNTINQFWDNHLNGVEFDKNEIILIQGKLQRLETILDTFDSEIGPHLNENEQVEDAAASADYREKLWDTMQKISIILTTQEKTVIENDLETCCSSKIGTKKGVKLPKLHLQKFNGEPIQWQEFWDSFKNSVHENPDLSSIEKFQHLKSLLTSEAKSMVEGYRLTEANYDTVVESLHERFGSDEVTIFSHFEKLLALPVSGLETRQLQATYDQAEKHIRSLVSLGISEEIFGLVFTPIILSKLPKEIRVELHRKNDSSKWKLSKLRELFREELKARQMGDWSLEQNSNDRKPKFQDVRFNKQSYQNSKNVPTTGALVQNSKDKTANKTIICHFCKAEHYSDNCNKFTTATARKEVIKGSHCYKCLGKGHISRNCKRNKTCFYCKRDGHHSALCSVRFGSEESRQNIANSGKASSLAVAEIAHCNNSAQKFTLDPLAKPFSNAQVSKSGSDIATIANSVHSKPDGFTQMQMAITSAGDKKLPIRVFFDNGSSRSYVTTSLVSKLSLDTNGKEVISNARFEDSTRRTRVYPKVTVPLIGKDGVVPVNALVTDTIACSITRVPIDISKYPILATIPLADPPPEKQEDVSIDVLVGSDHYYQIVSSERIDLPDGLTLLGSKFGYITAGKITNSKSSQKNTFMAALFSYSSSSVSYQNDGIERFWSLEDVGVKDDSCIKDDDLALQRFHETVRLVNGRYQVGWPWKNLEPELSENYELAYRRLYGLMNRLQERPDLLDSYNQVIIEQLSKGIIEEVPNRESTNLVHYLPHHCVIRQDHTTKVRIVYDASSKANKNLLSLNECLLRGPVYLQDLCGLLLRFRTKPYAVISDIEKAFLQLSIQPSDRDVTRFLWLKDPKKVISEDNLITYRFQRVLFGIISSPFLLSAAIRHFLSQKAEEKALDIRDNIYVDNVITGCKSVTDCKNLYAYGKQVFGEMGMNLREWQSNCTELMKLLPEKDTGKPNPKVLGMKWNTSTDELACDTHDFQSERVQTKRHLLHASSKIFDPCGLFSPITLQSKLLVQELWKRKIKWDENLPQDITQRWLEIADCLQAIPTITIPRFIGHSESEKWEIHCFCDASAKAYSAVLYLISEDQNGSPTLYFSKTKLTPLKPNTITLPRLELMAVLIGTRMSRFVIKHANLDIKKVYVWTDSKCVLHWINSQKLLSLFVGNRVREIKQNDFVFRYVPTTLNPADICSRGMTFDELKQCSLWWKGPGFLTQDKNQWPICDINDQAESASSSKDEQNLPVVTLTSICQQELIIDFNRFSSFLTLVRVMAWIKRFVKNLKQKVSDRVQSNCYGNLTTDELKDSENYLIKFVQADCFGLTNPSQNNRNLFKQLGVYTDESGLLRCSGRFKYAAMSENFKFPYLLPKIHPFTKLVILHYHKKAMHSGPSHTLGLCRQRFWIPCGRSVVKTVLDKCNICRLAEGGSYAMPPYAPLPQYRISPTKPFSHVGVDYFGPLYVKMNDEVSKVWICLFTCTAIRAIHLEVVTDMTTGEFMLALRRFCAIYGTPKTIISDNGKQFVLAKKVLKTVWSDILNSTDVQDFSSSQGINWLFIPEYAPWMGGFYERMVGTVKRSLKKVLGKRTVDLGALQTMVYEVSSVINSRPLVMSNDINDAMLSPNHLLGRVFEAVWTNTKTEGIAQDITNQTFSKSQENFGLKPFSGSEILQNWKEGTKLLNCFWDIWKSDYLTQLRQTKQAIKSRNANNSAPEINSVVLIKSNLPRPRWSIGKIIDLHISKDGVCRSVTVQLPNSKKVIRPIKLLYPIECEVANNGTTKNFRTIFQEDPSKHRSFSSVVNNIDYKKDSVNEVSTSGRPKRLAAENARKKIKEGLDNETFCFINISCSNDSISESSMSSCVIKITGQHHLSRFYSGHEFVINENKFSSIEMGTWYVILKKHGMNNAANTLANHPGLQRNPAGIEAWIKQVGFHDRANSECILNLDRIYYSIMEHCLYSSHSVIKEEFETVKKLQDEGNYGAVKFWVCTRGEYVYSTGIGPHFTDTNKHSWKGFNVYGDLLTALYDHWKNKMVIQNFSLTELVQPNVTFTMNGSKVLLLISDSLCRQVKSIRFADIVPPISGATFDILGAEIARKKIPVQNYKYVWIECGTNMVSNQWGPHQWKKSWKVLKKALEPALGSGSTTKIIMHSPVWYPSPRFSQASEFSCWMKAKLKNMENITYYDWSSPEQNPYVMVEYDHYTVNPRMFAQKTMHFRGQQYVKDDFHFNHEGWLLRWRKVCQDYPQLQLLPVKMSREKYPNINKHRKKPMKGYEK